MRNYILDQVRAMACFKNEHKVEGRGRVMIYVRMNTDYRQIVSKRSLWQPLSVKAKV